MRIIIMLFIIPILVPLSGQKTTTSDYIEGGKVLLEFIKLFKPSNNKQHDVLSGDCKKLKQSDITFTNGTNFKIKVLLTDKNNSGEKYELIIQKEKHESIYNIDAAIYICVVLNQDTNRTIKKGDIKIMPCENPNIKIE